MATDFDPGSGLGPRLRQVRESRAVSVRELARRVGCSASLISQVERGLSMPSVGVLYSLASELDCSLDFLLFGTGREAASPGSGVPADGVPAGGGAADAGGDGALALAPAGRGALTGGAPGGGGLAGAGIAGAAGAFRGEVPVVSSAAAAAGSDGVVQRGCDRRIIDLASGVRWERLTPGADELTDFLEVTYSPGGHSTDERRPLRHEGREYGLILSGALRANVGFETYELNPGDSIAFDSSTPHEYWNTTGDYVHAVWVVVHAGHARP